MNIQFNFIGIYTVNYEKKRKDNKIQNDKKAHDYGLFYCFCKIV